MAAGPPASFGTALLTPPSEPAEPHHAAPSSYRPPAQLPYELANHCSVFLESGQYLEGLSLLDSLLASGTSISTASRPQPALLPPTQLFELSATLIVHPALTTRASSNEKTLAANAALNYLRAVNRAVGPVNASFARAFTFPGPGSSRSRSARQRDPWAIAARGAKDLDEERPIKSALANQSGLWAQAEDLWHIVGWAFNCSIKHRARWARWKVWMELMLEIMEDDWRERGRMRGEALEKDGFVGDDLLLQSIIATHLVGANASALSARRRILRAILADGGAKATGEFKEVFKNELKRRKKVEATPIKEINLKEGDFGDLDANPDEDEEDDFGGAETGASTRTSSRKTSKRRASLISPSSDTEDDDQHESLSGAERLGGIESVNLRQRFLALLTNVATALPMNFTSREQLFDSYTEHFRPLPTSIFTVLVHTSLLSVPAQCVLAANTLLPLLPTSPPTYNLILPSQAEWEIHFLPHPANTHGFGDNAKVNVLLQQVLQITMPDIQWSKEWADAVLKGVRARRKRALGQGKSGGGGLKGDEIEAQRILQESESFLLLLVQWVEDDADVPAEQRPPREDLMAKQDWMRGRSVSTSGLSSALSELSEEESEIEVYENDDMMTD